MPISAPPKFKLLVCHGRDSVDYGGSVPPPTRTRSQFTIQQVTLATGNGRIGGPIQAIPAPTSSAYRASCPVSCVVTTDGAVRGRNGDARRHGRFRIGAADASAYLRGSRRPL